MGSEIKYPPAGTFGGGRLAVIDLAGYAAAVHAWMNKTIFVDILKAVEVEAAHHGLQFIRGATGCILSDEIHKSLGMAAMRAQLRHVSPQMSAEDVETSLTRWLADGDCTSWVNGILGALEAQGVGIVIAVDLAG